MKKTLILLLLVIGFSTVKAQYATSFEYTLEYNEYNNLRLFVKPIAFDASRSPETRTSGVYGIRICYSLKGEKKAYRGDMTRKIVQDGVYTYSFSAATLTKEDISNLNIEFFMATDDRENWPSKDECY